MKRMATSMRTLTLILCLALGQCGFSTAWAGEVAVQDAPEYDFCEGGPTAGDLSFQPAGGGGVDTPSDLAMLYTVPTAPDGAGAGATPAGESPLRLQAGSGQDTRVGVDLATADRATDGWPWWGKALVVGGCIIVAGIATWAIVEAVNDGSHDGDSSSHATVSVGGQNNSVTVNYDNRGGGYSTSSESRSEYK